MDRGRYAAPAVVLRREPTPTRSDWSNTRVQLWIITQTHCTHCIYTHIHTHTNSHSVCKCRLCVCDVGAHFDPDHVTALKKVQDHFVLLQNHTPASSSSLASCDRLRFLCGKNIIAGIEPPGRWSFNEEENMLNSAWMRSGR